jgi:hypothetical protein
LTLCGWATPRAIVGLSEELSVFLDKFSVNDWSMLYRAFRQVSRPGLSQKHVTGGENLPIPKEVSAKVCVILSERGTDADAENLYCNNLLGYRGMDEIVLRFAARMAYTCAKKQRCSWDDTLETIRFAHKSNVSFVMTRDTRDTDEAQLPENIASRICAEAALYPETVVGAAERRLTAAVGANAPKLLEEAETDCWFQ